MGELPTRRRDKALASVNRVCQRRNKVVFDEDGSYIEKKASGWKVPTLVETGVYVIDENVKDLIDTGILVVAGLGERR